MVKLDSVEIQLSHLLEERKSVDRETQGLRNQLDKAEDMVRVCCSLHNQALCLGFQNLFFSFS